MFSLMTKEIENFVILVMILLKTDMLLSKQEDQDTIEDAAMLDKEVLCPTWELEMAIVQRKQRTIVLFMAQDIRTQTCITQQ